MHGVDVARRAGAARARCRACSAARSGRRTTSSDAGDEQQPRSAAHSTMRRRGARAVRAAPRSGGCRRATSAIVASSPEPMSRREQTSSAARRRRRCEPARRRAAPTASRPCRRSPDSGGSPAIEQRAGDEGQAEERHAPPGTARPISACSLVVEVDVRRAARRARERTAAARRRSSGSGWSTLDVARALDQLDEQEERARARASS